MPKQASSNHGRASKIVLGAYPIKHHLECPVKTLRSVSGPEDLRLPPTSGLQARLDAGVVFEADMTASMLETFAANGWRRIDIACDGTRAVTAEIDALGRKRLGKGLSVVNLTIVERDGERPTSAKRQCEAATLAACRAGAHVIFGGRLSHSSRVGEPDILVRESWENPAVRSYLGGDFKDHLANKGQAEARAWKVSQLVAPAYELATDLAMSGTPQLNDSLQLVHYWYLLNGHGLAGPRIGGIIGRESVMVWRDLDARLYDRGRKSAFEVYDQAHTDTLAAIEHERARMLNPDLSPQATPELKSACGECEWRDVCREELESMGHITLLPGITPSRARAHYEVGVETIRELAALDTTTALLVAHGVDTASLVAEASSMAADTPVSEIARPRDVAALAQHGVITAGDAAALCSKTALYSTVKVHGLVPAIDQARVARANRVHRARGVDFVAIDRSAVEIDVDIEDDSGGLCYLIGVHETIRSRGEVRTRYVPFVSWDHTEEGEARVFGEFFTYILEKAEWARSTKVGALRAYHYTDHESRFFLHLAAKHAGKPGVPSVEQVTEFLESEMWIDLYPILAQQLVWPTDSLTLKSLAKYVKFFWRDDEPGGANSVAWYRIAVSDSPEAQEMRTRVLEYNEDDVLATLVLRDWVSRLGNARRPGQKLPSVDVLESKYGRRVKRPGTVPRRAAA